MKRKRTRKTPRKSARAGESKRGAFERHNPWTTLRTRLAYRSPWIEVHESDVIQPSGNEGLYSVVHFRNIAVGIVALDPQDRVLLVGQYRFALGAYSWELPEGGCPLGTSPLATAKRELKEETGYSAQRWTKILEMHLSNSSTNERAVIYLARGLKPGRAEPEGTEVLKVKKVTLASALRMVESGKITDAISVAGLLQVHFKRLKRHKQRNASD